jgi:hypothetical protein
MGVCHVKTSPLDGNSRKSTSSLVRVCNPLHCSWRKNLSKHQRKLKDLERSRYAFTLLTRIDDRQRREDPDFNRHARARERFASVKVRWYLSCLEHMYLQKLQQQLHSLRQLGTHCANWPEVPSVERQVRSSNAYRAATSSTGLGETACAVCGELVLNKDIQTCAMDADSMQFRHVLRAVMKGEQLVQTQTPRPTRHLLDGLELEPAAVLPDGSKFTICRGCERSVSVHGTPPSNALLNFPVDKLPDEFDLTIPEQLLISRLRIKTCIVRLHHDVHGNEAKPDQPKGPSMHASKGHCVAFPSVCSTCGDLSRVVTGHV